MKQNRSNALKITLSAAVVLLHCGIVDLARASGGIVVDGAVAETKEDSSCYPADGDAFRNDLFVPCGNGTMLDTSSGLIWLRDASCDELELSWWNAQELAANLSDGQCGLSDGSQPGDWRLPTSEEFYQILRSSCDSPRIVGRAGACYTDAFSDWALDVKSDYYWTSTGSSGIPEMAVAAELQSGYRTAIAKTNTFWVWPVRSVR
jgi:hypothetical protein